MARKHEAICILIDVGSNMQENHFEAAVKGASIILQQKIFAESKDEASVVLFGSSKTNNSLNTENPEFYNHIDLMTELGPVLWPTMEEVMNLSIDHEKVSFVDALTVAADYLAMSTSGKRGYSSKQLVLFSNLGDCQQEDNNDEINQLIYKIKQLDSYKLTYVGLEIPEVVKSEPGFIMMEKLLEAVGGDFFTFEAAAPKVPFFSPKIVESGAAWRCDLEMGTKHRVPVCGYIVLRDPPTQLWKDVYTNDPCVKVTLEQDYQFVDEVTLTNTEVPPDDVVNGYRYGNSIIPYSVEDQSEMTYESKKCLKVLGFTGMDNIHRHYYTTGAMIFLADDRGGEPVLRTINYLIKQLHQKQKVAICRRVYRDNCAPKIGMLKPRVDEIGHYFLWIELPFAEDVHNECILTHLPVGDPYKMDAGVRTKRPIEEQVAAMENLIVAADLTEAIPDGNGGFNEAFVPTETPDVVYQIECHCLLAKGLHPDSPIPDYPPEILNILERPALIQEHMKEPLQELKRLLKLEKISTDDDWGNRLFDGQTDAEEGRGSISDDLKPEAVTVTNLDDFREQVKTENKFIAACYHLKKLIEADLGNPDQHDNVVESLIEFRRSCISYQDPSLYNDFIRKIKKQIADSNDVKFWGKFCKQKLTLIGHGECPSSIVSQEEQNRFNSLYSTGVGSVPEKVDVGDVDGEIKSAVDDGGTCGPSLPEGFDPLGSDDDDDDRL